MAHFKKVSCVCTLLDENVPDQFLITSIPVAW